MGASYLGFLRRELADLSVAKAVATDFCALYNVSDEHRQARVSTVTKAVYGRAHLLLRYVEWSAAKGHCRLQSLSVRPAPRMAARRAHSFLGRGGLSWR